MSHYFIVQYPYQAVQIALCQNGTIIEEMTEHKFDAMRTTIPNMQTLLSKHNLALQDITFFGVNVGPGPYNTLRGLLTMINGIAYAIKIPMVSMNGLELLELEYPSTNSIVLLHAFANHLFYRMKTGDIVVQGGASITEIIDLINKVSTTSPIIALGNGAQMHKNVLLQKTNLIFADSIPEFNSLHILAQKSFEKFKRNECSTGFLKPAYFDEL